MGVFDSRSDFMERCDSENDYYLEHFGCHSEFQWLLTSKQTLWQTEVRGKLTESEVCREAEKKRIFLKRKSSCILGYLQIIYYGFVYIAIT